MYYLIKNGEILGSSDQYISGDGETIQKDFTPEEQELILQKWDYIDDQFVKGDRAIEYETHMVDVRKKEIVMELGKLKQEKDGLEIVMEDTSEVDAKITQLKNEYKSLILK